mgnify:CR=1 FL=1
MKTYSLIKAVLSQDMNMFNYSAKRNSSKFVKTILPIILFLIVALGIGTYAYMIGNALHEVHLTYIMLTMFLFLVTVLTFIEGIYKSQGILFEAKDNDLLFSLPISKSKILFLRIFKLLLFQYIYNLMFLLPAFIIYIYFEHPGISFYLLSFLMTILLPIIPTIISSFLGYLVKMFSSKSRFKKIIQTVLSLILFFIIYIGSIKLEGFVQNIASKAVSINDMLVNIYYPIGAYVNLINQFNILTFLKLLLINIIPFMLFIYIGAKYYFKIISNEKSSNTKVSFKKEKFVKNSPLIALVKKELKRYFSSPVYMLNTSIGLVIVLIVTIAMAVKGSSVFELILKDYGYNGGLSIEVLYYFLMIFAASLTSITSSCISLEGKTINITKSLPVSEKAIMRSKLIYPYISEFIFFIVFKPSVFYIIVIILGSLLSILLSSSIGLFINLKYPKMNAMNDTEVVKQSMSSMLSVFMGMIVFFGSILGYGLLIDKINSKMLLCFNLLVISLLDVLFYYLIIKVGTKDYKNLNV